MSKPGTLVPTLLASIVLVLGAAGCESTAHRPGWQPLFQGNTLPADWVVRAWNDVSTPPANPTTWRVDNGTLHGGEPRGSWLLWERECADFDLEFDFLLGERGNSGVALRAPLAGDPAFDGIELQMADLRYNPEAKPAELTGGLYRAKAPLRQAYKPTQWNHYEISLRGDHLLAHLNGTLVQDTHLDHETTLVKRHDGRDTAPLRERPRHGHIGFQELSRDGQHVQIRNARIRIVK